MPQATAVGYPPIEWFRDIVLPIQHNPPVQGSTANPGVSLAVQVQSAWPFAQRGRQGATPTMERATAASAGTAVDHRTISGRWARRYQATTGATRSDLMQFPHYMPALARAEAPSDDDDAHRIAWLRAYVFSGGSAGAATDSIGIGLVPDDGTPTAAAASMPSAAGGFGVYKLAGANDLRYASYGAAGALLEAIALAPRAGWHTIDFIIRQARRGDASTPWLTVRHEGVDIVRERPFGSATLADPLALRPNTSGFAIIEGGSDAGFPWNLSLAWRWRQGRFHPDGHPAAA